MKALLLAAAVIASAPFAGAADAPREPQQSKLNLLAQTQYYWVYCINGKTSVEMWDLDQMQTRHGSNVCQLHRNTSSSGATDWMNKNFPSGTCSCS